MMITSKNEHELAVWMAYGRCEFVQTAELNGFGEQSLENMAI
jgi:hypothetical protein